MCVYFNFYVVKVPSLIGCSPAVGGKLLALPPAGGPVCFCVSDLTGSTLQYDTGTPAVPVTPTLTVSQRP